MEPPCPNTVEEANALMKTHMASNNYPRPFAALEVGEWRQEGDVWILPIVENNLPDAAKAYPSRLKLAPFTNELRMICASMNKNDVEPWLKFAT